MSLIVPAGRSLASSLRSPLRDDRSRLGDAVPELRPKTPPWPLAAPHTRPKPGSMVRAACCGGSMTEAMAPTARVTLLARQAGQGASCRLRSTRARRLGSTRFGWLSSRGKPCAERRITCVQS